MFARITPFKMKKSHRDEAIALLDKLKPEIMGLPGMRHFTHAMDEDGRGYVVSLVESREVSEGNADKVKALWANFADHLETQPKPEGYEVIADWEKVSA